MQDFYQVQQRRVYSQLKQILIDYNELQEKGISVFSGSLNDHLGRLEWDQHLPNFWSVPILDENKYSYIQLKRDCLIQDCLKRPREQNEVLLVYESNPDWLIMIDETNDPLKRSQLYIFDLATVKEENILRKFEVNFIRILQRNMNS